MTEEMSGVTAGPVRALESPAKLETANIALAALLAVVIATAASLGRRRRRRFMAMLARVAEDWEQAGSDAEMAGAARRFIRPVLRLLSERA